MLCLYSPFGILVITRFFLIIWTLKYNTIGSLIIIIWLYYSIFYTNAQKFCKISPIILFPIFIFQILGTKLVTIPFLIDSKVKYLGNFGCYLFDNENIQEMEYCYMFGIFCLVCLSFKMSNYLNQYYKWRNQEKKSDQTVNNLEITIIFLLQHTEKLFIILLYILGFDKLNIVHSFLLCFMIINLFWKKWAHKHFIFVVILLLLKTSLRYCILMCELFDVNFNETELKIFQTIGIDVKYNPSVQVYKLDFDWEFIIIFFSSYIQLKINRYLEALIPFDYPTGTYVKFCTFCYTSMQKFELWLIYLIALLLLSFQETTFILTSHAILIILIMAIHVHGNLIGHDFKGYNRTLILWTLLSFWNGFVLIASYIFCFVVYTIGLDFSSEISQSTRNLIKMVGFDFVPPTGMQLQITFFPEFLFLYLNFLARWQISSRIENVDPINNSIQISNRCWDIFLALLDIIAEYFFHFIFLLISFLSIFWSLNGSLLVFLVFFAIHYGSLHMNYLKVQNSIANDNISYPEKDSILIKEAELQKGYAISQRKKTLSFLIIFTAIILLFCQIFRLLHNFKIYFDKNMDGELRVDILQLLNSLEAISTFFGTFRSHIRNPDSFFYSTYGYILILYVCAIEAFCIAWYQNRAGYSFIKVKKIDRVQSSTDIKEANITGVESHNIKYKIIIMMIIKSFLEYVIVGAFLFSAAMKNNIITIMYIPVAIICCNYYMTLKISYYFSVYSWILLILQYLLCLINLTNVSSPQFVDDTIFMKVFHLTKWPIYKIFLGEYWLPQSEWARYFGMGNTPTTRVMIVYDILTLFIQFVYFQHFCHSFFSLSQVSIYKRSLSIGSQKFKTMSGYLTQKSSGVLRFVCDVLKKLFVMYSHIVTLFILLLLNTLGDGLIAALYITFSIIFMQFDLFNYMGLREWSLPFYLRYILKPFVLFDIIFQFIFQIPSLKARMPQYVYFIGIEDFNEHPLSILIKVCIFAIVLYQGSMYASSQYCAICSLERTKMELIVC